MVNGKCGEFGGYFFGGMNQAEATRQHKLFQDVFTAQQYLINSKRLRKDQWDLCARYLRPKEYAEIVEERACNRKCGYIMCDLPIQSTGEYYDVKLAKYRIEDMGPRNIFDPPSPVPKQLLQYNRKKGKFVDVKEELHYCCKKCYVDSQVLSKTLDSSPVNLRELPAASFKECAQLLVGDITSSDEISDTIPSIVIPQRALGHVREEIESVNATSMVTDIKVTENEQVEPPSDVFEDKMEIEKKKISKKLKVTKLELPFAALMYQFLEDSVNDKTIAFLSTLEDTAKVEKRTEEDSTYWFPPLSSEHKRFEVLQTAVSNQ